jgi:hypothetical protein
MKRPLEQEILTPMYDPYDYVFSWQMRRPDPDPRQMAHVLALREARRQASPSRSPLAWLSDRLGTRSEARVETCSMTTCGTAA